MAQLDRRLIGKLAKMAGVKPVDLLWITPGDALLLRALHDGWEARFGDAAEALDRAKVKAHAARWKAGLCEEHPLASDGSIPRGIGRPTRDGQIVAVGVAHARPDSPSVCRVSRFNPGDVPEIDAAREEVERLRAEIRADLERVRAGR
jgi:hypothetical protein